MYSISTNGILWLSKDGFLIKRISDAKYFLTEMIRTEKAIIQIREPNVIYQLRKEDGLWKRICMIEINDSGLYVEHDTELSQEEIYQYVFRRRKYFNQYFFKE